MSGAYRETHIVDVKPGISDVLLVEHVPGQHSGAVFIGRLLRLGGRKWEASPLIIGSYGIDLSRTREFRRRSDAVEWLVVDLLDQLDHAKSFSSAPVIGEA